MASTPNPRALRLKIGTLFALLLLGLSLGSCVDGSSPIDLTQEQPVALLSLAGDFTRTLVDEGGAPINRIRVTARVVGTGEVVGQKIEEVSSTDATWTVDIKVDIPTIPNPQIVLTVELINVTAGVETVEWSGQTAAIALSATTTATNADVEVVRGPVDNLAVTAVRIIAPENIRVGKSVALDATVATSASGGTPQIYWSSLNPEIGTVSESGVFTAVAAGMAEVKATVGAATHVKSIEVLPAIAKVVVEPGNPTIVALGVEVTFTAWVLDTNDEPVDGEAVTWTVDRSDILEDLGNGTFVTRANGIATVTATSVSEPTLSGTAKVEVIQMPETVEVTPAEVTLEAVEETAQFTAQAFDPMGNPIEGALFAWGSDDETVVTMDQAGLATAQGGGETEIWAEVLHPVGLYSPTGSGAQGVEGGTGVYGRATVVVDLPLSLSLAPTDANIPSIGATVQMIVTAEDGSGNKITGLTYAWTSSDPGVATVDANGLVTAVKDGQTTITVTSAGVSATAVVEVKQAVAAIRWVQEPSDGVLWELINPPPSVEVVDANGHRVEGFVGEVSLEATWMGCCLSPPAQPSATPTGPQPNVGGNTTVAFQSGLALFDHVRMIDSSGLYQLTAMVLVQTKKFYAVSVLFFISSYYY